MTEYHYGRTPKNIKKALVKKCNEWLDSIKDRNVAEAAREGVIVTGGSITSMLMGDKVNDYDIYFSTADTAEMVANYYINEFKKLHSPDGELNDYDIKVIRDRDNDDRITVFVRSAGIIGEPNSQMEEEAEIDDTPDEKPIQSKEKYRPVFLSSNAITLSDSIQLIMRFHGDPEEIHKSFDFVHATCWFKLDGNELVTPTEALQSMLSRQLIYRGSLYPICSIFRMKKFINRGWRISAGEMLKIMWQISELNLTSPKVLMEQLTGVDQLYLNMLIRALKDVSPENLTSGHVAAVIDRIFNDEEAKEE